MRRSYTIEGTQCVLAGDTFPIKERIKALGFRWDGAGKRWIGPHTPETLVSLSHMDFVALLKTSPVQLATEPSAPAEGAAQFGEKTWNVREFVSFVAQVIQRELGGSYWVTGEISSLKQSNGHVYFDLAESENEVSVESSGKASALSCALWAGKRKLLAEKLGEFQLAEGLKIRVLIHCEFRRDQSRLSAVVDDIDMAFTLGSLALNRQAIVRELRKRGLYDRNKSTELSPVPHRIALITAGESRALSDFLDELKQSGIAFSVTFFDCHMQGENTSRDVCYALSLIAKSPANAFDCVVITRGGGSRLDLRWFDDLEICKAIAYSPIPVLTAIGHFDDVSIADEVAWCAEKTPTGAAGFFADRVSTALNELFLRVDSLSRRTAKRIHAERESLTRHELRLSESAKRRIATERQRLLGTEQTLALVRKSSDKTLERGYALMRDKLGRVLTASQFLASTPPREFTLTLKDAKTGNLLEVDTETRAVRTISPETKDSKP